MASSGSPSLQEAVRLTLGTECLSGVTVQDQQPGPPSRSRPNHPSALVPTRPAHRQSAERRDFFPTDSQAVQGLRW